MKKLLIFIGFIALFVLGLGYYIYLENSTVPDSTAPEIDKFVIDNNFFVVRGNFLTGVEIWYQPDGIDSKSLGSIKLGNAFLQSTDSENNQIWTLPVPAQSLAFKKVLASATGSGNQKAKELFLDPEGETDLRQAITQLLAAIPMIGIWDNTRSFSFPLNDKIILKLEENKYPKDNIVIEPRDYPVETTVGLPEVPLDFYAVEYAVRQMGSSTITNNDFKIYINAYLQNGNRIYKNDEYKFSFNYPPEDIVNSIKEYEYLTGRPLVRVDLPHNQFINTNLNEASLMIGASREPGIIAKCGSLSENEQKKAENMIINNVEFMVFEDNDAAAGNRYETASYRTVKNGACYEASLLIHYGNIENYEPGTFKEFDHQKASDGLMKILETLTIDN